jgi:hypothetical protein
VPPRTQSLVCQTRLRAALCYQPFHHLMMIALRHFSPEACSLEDRGRELGTARRDQDFAAPIRIARVLERIVGNRHRGLRLMSCAGSLSLRLTRCPANTHPGVLLTPTPRPADTPGRTHIEGRSTRPHDEQCERRDRRSDTHQTTGRWVRAGPSVLPKKASRELGARTCPPRLSPTGRVPAGRPLGRAGWG